MRTTADIIADLPSYAIDKLPAPAYSPPPHSIVKGLQVGLAVGNMKQHMTDEGYQLFLGLEAAGYIISWEGCDVKEVDNVLSKQRANTLLVQDKREWEGLTADRSKDPALRFRNIEVLRDRPDIFKGTVLKDAHANPPYHRQSAEEIGCHYWVVYYHPDIVVKQAPYVRREHLVRTYHSIDPKLVPKFEAVDRMKRAVISGAISGAYPMRTRLTHAVTNGKFEICDHLRHPGYHRNGCSTPDYLRQLSRYRVAICTSSRYGYALRKIIEATACGCIVITDLPSDEVLPEISPNLIRVSSDIEAKQLTPMVLALISSYDPDRQQFFADKAKAYYSYQEVGRRLASDIENLRGSYSA